MTTSTMTQLRYNSMSRCKTSRAHNSSGGSISSDVASKPVVAKMRASRTPRSGGLLHGDKCSYRTPRKSTAFRRSRGGSCLTDRGSNTAPPLPSGDRFIPDRSRVNQSALPRLWKSQCNPQLDSKPSLGRQEYNEYLRRVLLGATGECSVLGFERSALLQSTVDVGTGSRAHGKLGHHVPSLLNPHSQSILCPMDGCATSKARLRRRVIFDASSRTISSGISCVPEWNVLSVSSSKAALAENEQVFLGLLKPGYRGTTLKPNMGKVSAVEWSETQPNHLAVGGFERFKVFDTASTKRLANITRRKGQITAFQWKGESGLMAAGLDGLRQYDLRSPNPKVPVFELETSSSSPGPTSKIHWEDHRLLFSCGDTVKIWDVRHSKQRVGSLSHTGVKDLAVCPHDSDVLATGGDNGVRFWNIQSGKPCGSICRPHSVPNVIWSPYRMEVMTSDGIYMNVWDVESSYTVQEPLAIHNPDDRNPGTVIVLRNVPQTPVGDVISVHDHTKVCCWEGVFGGPKVTKRGLFEGTEGFLKCAPVIR